jgi:hypothetical protein
VFGILVFWPGQEVWYLVFWYFGSAVGAGVWCFVTWRTPPKHRPGQKRGYNPHSNQVGTKWGRPSRAWIPQHALASLHPGD